MARKIMTRKKLKKELSFIIDEIGHLKEDKFLISDQIDANVDEAKTIFRRLRVKKHSGEFYDAVYESFDSDKVDWKALALSFKPTKRKIKKFTSSQKIERLKTFDK